MIFYQGDDDSQNAAKLHNITVCIRHTDTTTNAASLLVETEVDLISGHVAHETSLAELRNHVHDLDHNHDRTALIVHLMLERTQTTCFGFKTTEPRSQINNIQPAGVSVQDEDSGILCRALYHTDNEHPMTAEDSPCFA